MVNRLHFSADEIVFRIKRAHVELIKDSSFALHTVWQVNRIQQEDPVQCVIDVHRPPSLPNLKYPADDDVADVSGVASRKRLDSDELAHTFNKAGNWNESYHKMKRK